MFDNIKNSINSIVPFSDEELIIFFSCLAPRTINKYDFFVQEGEYCRDVAFINKGAVRLYYIKNGKEHISDFYFEGSWISEYASFLSRQKSLFYIDALEDSELFILSYKKMQMMYEKGRLFERFGRIMAEQLFLKNVKAQSDMLLYTPEQRYLKLLKERPHLFSLVPLKQIASYLGIEPESLSRIRKRIK